MTVVMLASLTAFVGLAVVARFRSRADRELRLGPELSRDEWARATSAAVDIYTAWSNANGRCADALRTWREATAPSARRAAYRAYMVELELEAAAAAELESHAMAPA